MKYLKIPQNEKFMRYFERVQAEARKFNAVFFSDWTNGWKDGTREVRNLDAAELKGWLIPLSKQDEFEVIWKNSDQYSSNQLPEWEVYFRSVEWHFEGEELLIEFWDHNPTPERKEHAAQFKCTTLDGTPAQQEETCRNFLGLLPGESFDELGRKQVLPLE